MKSNINAYLRKNYIINNILNKTEWKHCFIGKNEIPKCDLKNKILYLLPFSNKDDEETEKLIYYYSLHENAHAIFTPYFERKLPNNLCKIINAIEDLRVEKELKKIYNIKEIIDYGNHYLMNKIKFEELNQFDYILMNLVGLSLNIITASNEPVIDNLFPIFEQWKSKNECNRLKSFCKVIEISKEIYDKLRKYTDNEEQHSVMDKIQNEDILYNTIYPEFISKHNFCELIDSSNDKIFTPNIDKNCYYKNFKEINYNIPNIYTKIKKDILNNKKIIYHQDRGVIDYRKIVSITKNLDKNIFLKKKKNNKKELCVSIILDQSNSMKKYFKNNLQEIIYLCNLLEKLDVNFQIIGSNTEKPNKLKTGFIRTVPINNYIYKNFNEKFEHVKYRLSNFIVQYHFVDNEIIDSCCKNMLNENYKNNIVIIFSDGEPKTGQNVDNIMKEILINKIRYWKEKKFIFLCLAFNTESPKNIYKQDFILLNNDNENNSIKIINEIKKYLI